MMQRNTIRYRSAQTLFGRPLVAVAFGPDLVKRERRGHARGIIAIGDVATGWVAVGAMARGFLAVGGLAFGGIAFGGLAVGVIAVGGLAIGTMAFGGIAIGEHVVSAAQQDPVALEFFRERLPWLRR